MPSPITVHFHVQPYIRKYLIYESINKAEPLIFKQKHHFVAELLPLLISNYRYQHSLFTDRIEKIGMEPTAIRLPYVIAGNGVPDIRKKKHLSPANERQYRNTLALYFNVFVTKFVHKVMLKQSATRHEAIKMLMDVLMIEDDEFNYDSFYRYYSRLTKIEILKEC